MGLIVVDALPQLESTDIVQRCQELGLPLSIASTRPSLFCFDAPFGELSVGFRAEHLPLPENMLTEIPANQQQVIQRAQAHLFVQATDVPAGSPREEDLAVFKLTLAAAELSKAPAMMFSSGINAHTPQTYRRALERSSAPGLPIPGSIDIDQIPLSEDMIAIQSFGLERYGFHNICTISNAHPEAVQEAFATTHVLAKHMLKGSLKMTSSQLRIAETGHSFPYSLEANQVSPGQKVYQLVALFEPGENDE